MKSLLLFWIGSITLLSFTALPALQAQTQIWRLELVEEEGLELGKLATAGGLTNEEGVRFLLEAGSVSAPMIATAIAEDSKTPVALEIFKKDARTIFEGTTDEQGKLVAKFRSGEDLYFRVTGAPGAAYQISVWRGPEIILPTESPLISMEDFGGIPEGAENAVPVTEVASATEAAAESPSEKEIAVETTPREEAKEEAAPESSTPAAADTVSESEGGNTLIVLLLVGIFLALAAIAFLLFRGQRTKSAAASWALGIFLLVGFTAETQANENVENSVDTRTNPNPVESEKRDIRLSQEARTAVEKFAEILDIVKEVSGGKLDGTSLDMTALKERGLTNSDFDVTGAMNTALNLMELFEIIDPREKFLQLDLNPQGLPVLPSRAMNDFKLPTKSKTQFGELQDQINVAKLHLEKNYVLLKETELKTNRLTDLADAAGGFNAIAGLYWSTKKVDPNDPMNKSRNSFYEAYDGGQKNGLEYLNEALKAMGEFEYENYGDRNWYLYYGLPYYNFMASRYAR